MADGGCATDVAYTGSAIEALMLKHGYTREPPSGIQQPLPPTPTFESFADVALTPEELRDVHSAIVTGEHKLEDYNLHQDELSYIQQLSVSQPQQTSPMHMSLTQESNGCPTLTNPRHSPSYHQEAAPTQTRQADTYQTHESYQSSPSNFSSAAQQPAQKANRAPMQPQHQYSAHTNSSMIQQPTQQANRGTMPQQHLYSAYHTNSMAQQPSQQAKRGPMHPRHPYSAYKNSSMVQQPAERNSGPMRPSNQFPSYGNGFTIHSGAQSRSNGNMSHATSASRPAPKRTFDQTSHSNENHIDNSNYALGDVLPMSDYPPMEGPGRLPTPQPNAGSARKRQRRTASTRKPSHKLSMTQNYYGSQTHQRALMPPPRVQRPSYDHLAPELRPNPYRQPRPAEYAWFHGLDYMQQASIAHSGLLSDPLPEWPSLEGIEDLLHLQTAPAAVVDAVPAARTDQEAAAIPVGVATEKKDDVVVVPSARDEEQEAVDAPAGGVVTEAQNNPAADRQLEATEAPASEVQNDGVVDELMPAAVAPPQDLGLDAGQQTFDFDLQEDPDDPFGGAMENWFQEF